MVRHRKNDESLDVPKLTSAVEESQARLACSLERLHFYATASRSFSAFIAQQNERMSTTIRTKGSKQAIELCISEAKRGRSTLITDLIDRWSDPALVTQRSARLSTYVDAMRKQESGSRPTGGRSGALNLPSYADLAHSAKVENSHLDPVLSAVTCLRPYINSSS